MSWTMYRWAWQLCSPLHIGATPAGSLNRTRLYIPARALWGALTAELARRTTANFPNYRAEGEKFRQQCRLSYLFPAEKVGTEWRAWLPLYCEGQGLVWRREDGQELEDRPFRQCLLSTRPGTAIEPSSDAAEEGTLREFEIINSYWPAAKHPPKPVAMVGYLFCRCPALEQRLQEIQELFVGGDTRYGLGHLAREEFSPSNSFFGGVPVEINAAEPIILNDFALAHTLPLSLSGVHGEMECVAGWDLEAGGLGPGVLSWAPGACWDKARKCVIREDGLWKIKEA